MHHSEGPNTLIHVTGFKGKRQEGNLARSLQSVFDLRDNRVHSIPGCPDDFASSPPWRSLNYVNDRVREVLQDDGIRALLVGTSNGGLQAFGVAGLRREISGLLAAVSIGGPLHPRVNVEPPPGGAFDAYHAQYNHRPGFAGDIAGAIQNLSPEERARFLTMGNPRDSIVPPEAQTLRNVRHVVLPDRGETGHELDPDKIAVATHEIVNHLLRLYSPPIPEERRGAVSTI